MDLGELSEKSEYRECKECGATFESDGEGTALQKFSDHVIEHQPKPSLPETFAQPGQRNVPAKCGVDGVPGDGKPGARDVRLAQVWQCLPELFAPLAPGARDPLSGQPGLPHT